VSRTEFWRVSTIIGRSISAPLDWNRTRKPGILKFRGNSGSVAAIGKVRPGVELGERLPVTHQPAKRELDFLCENLSAGVVSDTPHAA
jgi:hypothetical protein